MRFSFKDWKFSEWFKGNGKTIKEIVKVGIPAVVAWLTIDPLWITFLTTIVGKFILDCLDYWISE